MFYVNTCYLFTYLDEFCEPLWHGRTKEGCKDLNMQDACDADWSAICGEDEVCHNWGGMGMPMDGFPHGARPYLYERDPVSVSCGLED